MTIFHALGLAAIAGVAGFGAGIYFKSLLVQKAKDALVKVGQ